MNVVVILASSRRDGNTHKMVQELEKHIDFYLINLLDYNIQYYDYEHGYVDDDFIDLMERIVDQFDLIIYATPVYWYTMSAQLKTFFDRHSDLTRVRKDLGRKLAGKTMAVLSCGYADDLVDSFDAPFRHTANYLGMNFYKNVYTWHTGSSELDQVVTDRIAIFANQIKTELP